MTDGQGVENTDRELWREREGDFYADSIFVTKEGHIGMDAGGHVIVKPLREWVRLASRGAGWKYDKERRTLVPPNGHGERLIGEQEGSENV